MARTPVTVVYDACIAGEIGSRVFLLDTRRTMRRELTAGCRSCQSPETAAVIDRIKLGAA